MSIQVQLITMALMTFCGMTMGLLYDTYRVMKGQTGLRGWLVIICDLLFWASCTFLVFGTLLRANQGIVRVYLFLGMGVGAWIYFALFHSIYVKWFLWLIRVVKAVYRFLVRTVQILIFKPIVFIYKVILTVVMSTAVFLWSVLVWIYRILLKMFVPVGKAAGKQGKRILRGGGGIITKLANLFKRTKKNE